MERRAILALAACVVPAAGSVLLIFALNYDAWGWLMWGRELAGQLPFTTAGYPSWKPLTGLISVPLAPLGDAAPGLWLVVARSGAAVALLLAYRLGRRAAGRCAGILAAAALLLAPGWLFQAGVGGSEPLLTALLLGALDRHLDRDDRLGLALAFLAALLRPESWPALLLSGAVAWRRAELRPFVLAALVAVPALWFGGEYLGSGDPFTGGQLARISKQATGLQRGAVYPPLVVLERSLRMLPLPVLLGFPVALAAGWHRRDPVLLSLCGGALLWTGEVAVMAGLGYAGILRFLFPAAAAAAVAGGTGLVLLIRRPSALHLRRALAVVVVVGLGLSWTGALPRFDRQAAMVERRADLDQSLARIMARVGPRPFGAARHVSAQGVEATALAWRLGVIAEPLRHAHVPGLALTLRDRPWPRLRRALRHDRRVETRTLARAPALTLLSTGSVGPRR